MERKQLLFSKAAIAVTTVTGVCLILAVLSGNHVNAQVQQPKWCLKNAEVDFRSSTPVVKSGLPGFNPNGNGDLINMVTDEAGDMLFYVNTGEVRNKHGDLIGNLDIEFDAITELNIVPKPGDACSYYIIHSEISFYPLCGHKHDTKLMWDEVDMTADDGKGEIVNSGTLNACNGYWTNFAVTNVRQVNKRFIYKLNEASQLLKFEVTSSGISSSPTTIVSSLSFVGGYWEPAELELSHDETKIAFTSGTDGDETNHDVIVIHLDVNGDLDASAGNHPTINGVSTYDVSSTSNTMTGVEFSPNGNYLYAAQQNEGIYQIELSTGQSNFFNEPDYGNSQLELAYNGNIYASNGDDLGRISDPDDAQLTTFTPEAIEDAPTGTAGWAGVYVLPDQIDGYDYTNHYQNANPECCVLISSNVKSYETEPETQVWSPGTGNNPLELSGDIIVDDEFRVKEGSDITLENMTFRFSENAKVIVEQGATLTLDNTIFTVTDCDLDYFWQGIEVWGTNTFQKEHQGHLNIENNSLIERAHVAVHVWKPGDYQTTGGRISAENSTFQNCRKSFDFQRYSRSAFQRIVNCDFILDNDYPNPASNPLLSQIKMNYINTAYITNNTFLMDNSYFKSMPPEQRGDAVVAIDVDLILSNNHIQGFYTGSRIGNVHDITRYRIMGNTFKENSYGLFSSSTYDPFITSNVFDDNTGVTTESWGFGMVLLITEGARVTSNEFKNHTGSNSTALYVQGYDGQGIGIYGNDFDNNRLGIYFSNFNQNLEPDCNHFTNTTYSDIFYDIHNYNNIIIMGSTSQPLQNLFSHSSTCDFYANGHVPHPATPPTFVFYNHHNSNYNNFLAPDNTQCNNQFNNLFAIEASSSVSYDASECPNAGPIVLNPQPTIPISGQNLISGKMGLGIAEESLSQINDSYYSLVDDGQTTDLLAVIDNIDDYNSNDVSTAVEEVAPFASPEVLTACIHREEALTKDDLYEVLSNNSPLPLSILHDSLAFKEPLENLYDDIIAGQTGFSPFDSLLTLKRQSESQMYKAVNDLSLIYVHDTIYDSPNDSIFLLLDEHIVNQEQLQRKLFSAWATDRFDEAGNILTLMDSIPIYESSVGLLNQIHTEYVSESDNPLQPYLDDSDFKSEIHDLAANEDDLRRFWARNIIHSFIDIVFTNEFALGSIPTGKKSGNMEETLEEEYSQIEREHNSNPYQLVPNPANENLRIIGGSDNTDFIEFTITEISGKIIETGRVYQNSPIQLNGYSAGLYLVIIKDSQSNRQVEKLIIK